MAKQETDYQVLQRKKNEAEKISRRIQNNTKRTGELPPLADQLKLDEIRREIERLEQRIPSGGPSPTTVRSSDTKDPQGRQSRWIKR